VKYVILHGAGMADVPREDLGGKTPLQAAATPYMDTVARKGELGLVTILADGPAAGSDVTQLAILGYDPRKFYQGPAPFEAAGLGVTVGEHDVVFRCSMVTLRANAAQGKGGRQPEIKKLGPHVVMEDATAGGIETEEARELIDAVNEQLGSETIQFYPGPRHRHLMVWVGGKARATCVNPHEIVGRSINEHLPTGDGSDILRKLMEASLIILRDHPVNDQRREAGLKPAHCLWLWGQGRAPRLPSLAERHQITGSIVSTSDLHRGIAICAGLEAVDPASRTDSDGMDFLSRGETALGELAKKDLVYVHAEVPPQVALGTDSKARLKVVEEFDQKIVGPILDGLPKLGAYRLLLICDHAAAAGIRPGAGQQAVYTLYEGASQEEKAGKRGFSEVDAEAIQAGAREATKLIARLLPRG
jgi:2,3-bisphosphoglycerate-independent phosphoglycerate mutase